MNLLGVAHYLQALVWQRDMIKIHTILGGKNPHPNFLVGGMACAINMNNDQAINQFALSYLKQLVQTCHDFIHKVYYPDIVAIAGFYKDYAHIGASNPNFFCTGDPSEINTGAPAGKGMIKPGVLLNGDYKTCFPLTRTRSRNSSPAPGTSTRKAGTRAWPRTTGRRTRITTAPGRPTSGSPTIRSTPG